MRIETVDEELHPTTCENQIDYLIIPGGVRFEHDGRVATSACKMIVDGNDYMMTAAHSFGDPVDCGRDIQGESVDQNDQSFGKVSSIYDIDRDYALAEKTNGSVAIDESIEYDGNRYDVVGYATNYEELDDSNEPIYKTGITTGYTEGTITGSGLSAASSGCIDLNGNAIEYSNNQAGGDSGCAPFYITTEEGTDYAVVTGIATLGDPDIGSISCSDYSADEYGNAYGASAGTIKNNINGTVTFGGATR